MSFDIPKECAADPYALAMLGGVQIFRIKARGKDLFDGKLGAHNRRDKVPLYAKKRPGRERAVELWQDRERALRILELSEAQPKRRGKPPAPGVEIFIGGPSPYDSPEEWTDERTPCSGSATGSAATPPPPRACWSRPTPTRTKPPPTPFFDHRCDGSPAAAVEGRGRDGFGARARGRSEGGGGTGGLRPAGRPPRAYFGGAAGRRR